MRPSSNTGRRPRGRPNRKHGPGQPGRNQSLDSSGPEGRIRGNASQIYERYLAMARDAYSSGDRVAAETFFQHAEHYYRVVNDSTDPEPLNPGNRPRHGEEANGQDNESAGNGRGQPDGAQRNADGAQRNADGAQRNADSNQRNSGGGSQRNAGEGAPRVSVTDERGGQTRGPSKAPQPVARDDLALPASVLPAGSAPLAQPAIAGLEPQPDLAESIPAAIPLVVPADDSGNEPVKPRRGRVPRKRLTTKSAAKPAAADSDADASGPPVPAAGDGGAADDAAGDDAPGDDAPGDDAKDS